MESMDPKHPDSLAQLQQELEQFRAAHLPRTKLPESLWQSAAELTTQLLPYSGKGKFLCLPL